MAKNTGSDHSFNEHQLLDSVFSRNGYFSFKNHTIDVNAGAAAAVADIDVAVLLFAILIFYVQLCLINHLHLECHSIPSLVPMQRVIKFHIVRLFVSRQAIN